MHENVSDARKYSLLGKSEIIIRNFPKGELPLGHIFHGFYSLILKENKSRKVPKHLI